MLFYSRHLYTGRLIRKKTVWVKVNSLSSYLVRNPTPSSTCTAQLLVFIRSIRWSPPANTLHICIHPSPSVQSHRMMSVIPEVETPPTSLHRWASLLIINSSWKFSQYKNMPTVFERLRTWSILLLCLQVEYKLFFFNIFEQGFYLKMLSNILDCFLCVAPGYISAQGGSLCQLFPWVIMCFHLLAMENSEFILPSTLCKLWESQS